MKNTLRWSPGSSPRCCSLLWCWAFSYTCLSSFEPENHQNHREVRELFIIYHYLIDMGPCNKTTSLIWGYWGNLSIFICVCVNAHACDSAVPSAYLYWCVMSCLSSEPTALVLMKRPTDLVDPLNLTNCPFERRTRSTTSALTWLHTQREMTRNNTDYKDTQSTENRHDKQSKLQVFTIFCVFLNNVTRKGLSETHLSKNKRSIVLLGQLSFLDGPHWGWSTTENPWQHHTSRDKD